MATAIKSGDKPAKTKVTAAPNQAAAKPMTAAKPAAEKKPAAAKPAAKAPAKKAATTQKSAPATRAERAALAPDQRRFYIEVAAYYIAERRGFQGGSELEDWTQAEAEIDCLLQQGILNP